MNPDLYKPVLYDTMAAVSEAHFNSPDEMWESRLKNAVTEFNERHGTTFDPHEAFIAWVKFKL